MFSISERLSVNNVSMYYAVGRRCEGRAKYKYNKPCVTFVGKAE